LNSFFDASGGFLHFVHFFRALVKPFLDGLADIPHGGAGPSKSRWSRQGGTHCDISDHIGRVAFSFSPAEHMYSPPF
jgi:hypothetical protein